MLVFLLSFLTSLASSFAGQNSAPLLKAIANSCGTKAYSSEIHGEHIDEMAACYQTGMAHAASMKHTPLGTALAICEKFKDSQRAYKCLSDFKDVAGSHDQNIFSIFRDCDKDRTITCFNERARKHKYIVEKNVKIAVNQQLDNHLTITAEGCGKNQAIASVSIAPEEVAQLAKCYQKGLFYLDQELPAPEKLTLEACSSYSDNQYRVECIKRVSVKVNFKINTAANLQDSVKRCLSPLNEKTKGKKTAQAKDPDSLYQAPYGCLKVSLESANSDVPGQTHEVIQGHR